VDLESGSSSRWKGQNNRVPGSDEDNVYS